MIYFFAIILLFPFKTNAQESDTSSLVPTTPEISTLLNSLIKAQPTSFITKRSQKVNERFFDEEKGF